SHGIATTPSGPSLWNSLMTALMEFIQTRETAVSRKSSVFGTKLGSSFKLTLLPFRVKLPTPGDAAPAIAQLFMLAARASKTPTCGAASPKKVICARVVSLPGRPAMFDTSSMSITQTDEFLLHGCASDENAPGLSVPPFHPRPVGGLT